MGRMGRMWEKGVRTKALFARVFGDAVEEFGGFGSVVSCCGGVGRGGVSCGAVELDVADCGDVDVL